MKPYSIDLRQKVLDAHLKNQTSIREIAEKFGVSDSFVRKLLKRHQETGGIEPKPHSGGASAKLTEEHYVLVESMIAENNNITLVVLCKQIEAKTGIRVSVPTMCRILQKLKLGKNKKSAQAAEV
ncbi:MAG: transposase [Snowella sp.]